MSRFVRDIDPAALRARAEQLDARALIVNDDLGVMSAHLLRWLLFAPCPLFVIGGSREQLLTRLTLAAHAYDTPLDARRALDKIELAESLEAAVAHLVLSDDETRHLVYFDFGLADVCVAGAPASVALDSATGAVPASLRLRRYRVIESTGQRDPQAFLPTPEGARIELPRLLPPTSTRRSPEGDWRAPLRLENATRVLPVDAAVLHLLDIAGGGHGSAEAFRVARGADANDGMGTADTSALPALAAEDVEIYEAALAHGACVREEVETSRGRLLVTRAFGDPAGRSPLILVNAFGVSTEVFEPLIATASERYWPVAHQSSAIPAWTRVPNEALLPGEVEDLVAVLDEYAEDGCVLLGWCNGAPLALEAALRRPALVRRLILLSGVYPAVGVPDTDYHRKLAQLLPTLSRSESACALYAKALYGSERAQVEQRPSTPGQSRLNHLLNRAFRTPAALFRYANYYVQFWKEGSIGSPLDADRERTLLALADRVRFVVASDDTIGPADASRVLARELGAREPRVAQSGGHYLLFDEPGRLLELIDA